MKNKLLQWKLAAILICGAAAMFTSCTNEDNPIIDPTDEPGAAYRALLQSLDWGQDTTFVYGHKVPDVDAVCSALSYAKLMRALGYNCKAKISSPINRETQFIAQWFGFDVPELKTSVAADTRLILTDHSDFAQCVDGAKQARILQKIDHHVEGDIKDIGIPYVRRKMIGSTCTIIYECYKELNIPIDDETAKILLAGLLSDTDNLNKTATQHEDSVAWTELVTKLNLENEVAEISRLMNEAANNFEGMNDSAVFVSDYKGYEMGGKAIGIGSLDCMGEEAEDFVNRMLAVLPAVLNENGLDMLFAKIDIHVPNPDESDPENPTVKDGLYFIYYGEGAQAVAETIFGPSVREGVIYSKEILSRKQIVPIIMEIMQ